MSEDKCPECGAWYVRADIPDYKITWICTKCLEYERQVAALQDTVSGLTSVLARLEAENAAWATAIDRVRACYPEDVFPPDSASPDAKAAKMARTTCDNIRHEQAQVLAALTERAAE